MICAPGTDCGWSSLARSASAGGQSEQPSEVNSSTSTAGSEDCCAKVALQVNAAKTVRIRKDFIASVIRCQAPINVTCAGLSGLCLHEPWRPGAAAARKKVPGQNSEPGWQPRLPKPAR